MSRHHVLLSVFLLATLTTPIDVWAQDGSGAPPPPPPAEGHHGWGGGGHKGGHHGHGDWKNLPPACKEKLEALHKEMKAKHDNIEATVKDKAEKHKQLEALREEGKSRREAILKECGAGGPPPSAAPSPAPASPAAQ